jgi:two-component system response regulator HydG
MHAVERAVLFSQGPRLIPDNFGELFTNYIRGGEGRPGSSNHFQLDSAYSASALPPTIDAWLDAEPGPLKAALEIPEALLIERALEACNGNRQKTASVLDINRSTLFNKMRKHGLLDFSHAPHLND